MTQPCDRDGAPLAAGDRCLIVAWPHACRPGPVGTLVTVGRYLGHVFCGDCGHSAGPDGVAFQELVIIRSIPVWASACPATWLKKLPPLDLPQEWARERAVDCEARTLNALRKEHV